MTNTMSSVNPLLEVSLISDKVLAIIENSCPITADYKILALLVVISHIIDKEELPKKALLIEKINIFLNTTSPFEKALNERRNEEL